MQSVHPTPTEGLLAKAQWRGRLWSLAAILVVSGTAWVYLAVMATHMNAMDPTAMSGGAMATIPLQWSAMDWIAMLIMWWVMMVAMMLPSATQMILIFSTVNRKRRERGASSVGTAFFGSGYLIVWGGFSAFATVAQWALQQAALLTPMMASGHPVFGGTLLVAAGVYQFTPLKHACLRHCRSPFDFVLNRWRDGRDGALAMGIEHGLFCLGCCAVMMALLFVFGVMNLLWIAALSVLVLIEKAMPGGPWIARAGGVAMIALGGVLLIVPEVFDALP